MEKEFPFFEKINEFHYNNCLIFFIVPTLYSHVVYSVRFGSTASQNVKSVQGGIIVKKKERKKQ